MPKKAQTYVKQKTQVQALHIKHPSLFKLLAIFVIVVLAFAFIFMRSSANANIKLSPPNVSYDTNNNYKYVYFIEGTKNIDFNESTSYKLSVDTNCIMAGISSNYALSEGAFSWRIRSAENLSPGFVSVGVVKDFLNVNNSKVSTKWHLVNDRGVEVATGETLGPVCSTTRETPAVIENTPPVTDVPAASIPDLGTFTASKLVPNMGVIPAGTFNFTLSNTSTDPKNLYHAVAVGYTSNGRTNLQYIYYDKGKSMIFVTHADLPKGWPDKGSKVAVILFTSNQPINSNTNLGKLKTRSTHQYTVDNPKY